MSLTNPNCLFCGYPRRSHTACGHCASTFPCCNEYKELHKKTLERENNLRDLLEELFAVVMPGNDGQDTTLVDWCSKNLYERVCKAMSEVREISPGHHVSKPKSSF